MAMNEQLLKERIQERLRSLVITVGVTDAEVNVGTDAQGMPDITVNTVTGNIHMDDNLSAVIAQAVATAVTEFLTKDVTVQIPNAQGGAATLPGYLE